MHHFFLAVCQLTPRCLLEPLRKLASFFAAASSFFSFRYCTGCGREQSSQDVGCSATGSGAPKLECKARSGKRRRRAHLPHVGIGVQPRLDLGGHQRRQVVLRLLLEQQVLAAAGVRGAGAVRSGAGTRLRLLRPQGRHSHVIVVGRDVWCGVENPKCQILAFAFDGNFYSGPPLPTSFLDDALEAVGRRHGYDRTAQLQTTPLLPEVAAKCPGRSAGCALERNTMQVLERLPKRSELALSCRDHTGSLRDPKAPRWRSPPNTSPWRAA